MEKFKGLKTYYISTLPISLLVVFVLSAFVALSTFDIETTLKQAAIYYATIGYALDLIYKLTMRNNEFYFYYNLGFRKLELIIYSFCISLIISFFLYKLIDVLWIV